MPPATTFLVTPSALADAASLGPLNDFVEGFIACEARVVNVLQVADTDPSPLVQACCAALHMFAESGDAPGNARPFIEAARRSTMRITPREQRFVEAVAAWVEGDLPRAIALHEEQAREHPRDLASLKLGQYHLFNLGHSPGMLRIVQPALHAAAEVPYLHGMAAFAWEQCHLLEQAEAAARRALAIRPKEPWAQHALAHVMITQGRITEGRDFMEAVSGQWTDLNSFMVTHNWWHLALFELELDHAAAVLDLYDRQVWGVVKAYSQDQIGAVSLLARLEIAGVDVGDRWQDVADHLEQRGDDHVQPFLDLQYLYGLGRAGRATAGPRLARLEAFAARAPDWSRTAWQQVAVPAARGLLAHASGDWQGAVAGLGQALPQLQTIGGSHAQRDLFEQLHLDALMRAGRWSSAQHLMQPRANACPQSLRLKRQLRPVYAALGLPEVSP
jgi:tetratricopeptide (TPR) repeat protein